MATLTPDLFSGGVRPECGRPDPLTNGDGTPCAECRRLLAAAAADLEEPWRT